MVVVGFETDLRPPGGGGEFSGAGTHSRRACPRGRSDSAEFDARSAIPDIGTSTPTARRNSLGVTRLD